MAERRWFGLLVVAALIPGLSRAEGATRVAVLVSAQKANDAAVLEQAIEARLGGSSGIRLLSAVDVAEALAVEEPIPPAVDAATRARADELFQKAHQAYIEADYRTALQTLDRLSADVERLGSGERIRAHILGAAVHIKLEDEPAARHEADLALVVAGDTPDLSDYPPSVSRIFDEQAPKLQKVTVTFEHAPGKAEVTLDDRPITGTSAVLPAGIHRLRVRAHGFRGIEYDLDLKSNRTLSLALAPAVDPPAERLIEAAVMSGGKVNADQRRALDRLADRLDADALVLALNSGGEKRAAIWWTAPTDSLISMGSFAAGPEGDGALAERVGGSLVRPAAPTPVPAATPVAAAPPTPVIRNFEGGAVADTRQHSLAGSNGVSIHYAFAGEGARLGFASEWGGLRWGAEATYLHYSSATFNVPGGAQVAANTGSDLLVRARIGYGWGGPGIASDRGWAINLLLEGGLDDYSGKDSTDPQTGQPLGINPGYFWPHGGPRLEGRLPIQKFVLTGSATFSFGPYQESPKHTTGDQGTPACYGYRGRLGVAYAPAAWSVGVEVDYATRIIDWSGASMAETAFPMVNTVDTVTTESVMVSAGYRF